MRGNMMRSGLALAVVLAPAASLAVAPSSAAEKASRRGHQVEKSMSAKDRWNTATGEKETSKWDGKFDQTDGKGTDPTIQTMGGSSISNNAANQHDACTACQYNARRASCHAYENYKCVAIDSTLKVPQNQMDVNEATYSGSANTKKYNSDKVSTMYSAVLLPREMVDDFANRPGVSRCEDVYGGLEDTEYGVGQSFSSGNVANIDSTTSFNPMTECPVLKHGISRSPTTAETKCMYDAHSLQWAMGWSVANGNLSLDRQIGAGASINMIQGAQVPPAAFLERSPCDGVRARKMLGLTGTPTAADVLLQQAKWAFCFCNHQKLMPLYDDAESTVGGQRVADIDSAVEGDLLLEQ